MVLRRKTKPLSGQGADSKRRKLFYLCGVQGAAPQHGALCVQTLPELCWEIAATFKLGSVLSSPSQGALGDIITTFSILLPGVDANFRLVNLQ